MGKRRVISLLMAFLLAASLLPGTAIQALASGGTVTIFANKESEPIPDKE